MAPDQFRNLIKPTQHLPSIMRQTDDAWGDMLGDIGRPGNSGYTERVDHWRKAIRSGEAVPPATVTDTGLMVDGHHRAAAALLEGKPIGVRVQGGGVPKVVRDAARPRGRQPVTPAAIEEATHDVGAMTPAGGAARRTLADAMPQLDADQAESVLSRLREADYPEDHPLVVAALARLGEAGGVRRRNRAARWFDPEVSARDERRADRQQRGTVAQQQADYRDYVRILAGQLEDATRGSAVTRQQKQKNARGRGMSIERILTSSPDTIRANLSDEALEWLARENGGPPLSFDAWRYANLGARDARAVASWQRRTAGYFSEFG